MKMSLRTQLLLIFTTVIVLIIGAVSLVTVALTNDHFDKYVTQRNSTTLVTIRQQIALSYVNNHDQWQAKQLREIRNTGYRAGVLATTLPWIRIDSVCLRSNPVLTAVSYTHLTLPTN